jgi:hypothetical protein
MINYKLLNKDFSLCTNEEFLKTTKEFFKKLKIISCLKIQLTNNTNKEIPLEIFY